MEKLPMQQDTQSGHLIDVPWAIPLDIETRPEAVRDGSTNSLEARAAILR